MKRVVVTGIGIVSSLGNNCREVLESLKNLKSGISFDESYREMGLRSNVAGNIKIDTKEHIDRKILRFMGDAAAYAYIAMKEAIANAGLTEEQVSNIRTGIVTGSGGASSSSQVEAADTLRASGVKRIGPYGVTKTMASTVAACLATPFKIKGVNYSISSACSTSAHCIGHAAELIQLGKQDIVFAGGGSILVMEEYEHAKARGANILCELTGYGATSDGYDMVQPSGEGAVRCMQMALAQHGGKVDYINAHGTSTPVGDTKELGAIREVFAGQEIPLISSTKSLSGHALGAAGSNEAIYSILMMQNDFACASANIQNLDEQAEGLPILRENREMKLNAVMSNSFGFGGTNATLIFSRVD